MGGMPAPAWRDMDEATARRMNALNARFYREQAASFSATRQAAWPGWKRCLDRAPAGPVRVLDLACGNLRFARFLQDSGAHVSGYLAVDNAAGLVATSGIPATCGLRYQQLDLVGALLDGSLARTLARTCPEPRDLAACFGFFHHVPTYAARERLLDALISQLRPGGICCVSFWRFMADDKLADRACCTTSEACDDLGMEPSGLGTNDYLLGWQGKPHAWRYCHHFDDAEIGRLAGSVAGRAAVIDRFRADGRTGALNEYLVLRRDA